MGSQEIDMITKRPRTSRIPYTVLTDQQVRNIRRDPTAFFQVEKPEAPYLPPDPSKGWAMDRYATCTNQFLYRGTPMSYPVCWIDQQWKRFPPELHNTCRLGASTRWGQDKIGNRTVQHFNKAEDTKRFVNTEMYRRPASNLPGPIHMSYGRPNEGYYAPKNPHFVSWFGTSVPLNRQQILQDIRPKTTVEYSTLRKLQKEEIAEYGTRWPEHSEYTDKFALNTETDRTITSDYFTSELLLRLERRKKYLQESVLVN